MSPPLKILVLGIALSWAASAQGALSSIDDPAHGPGSVTRDTAAGLDWLDLPLTTSIGPLDLISRLAPGGEFEGWRVATAAELETLLANAGFAMPLSGGKRLVDGPAAELLTSLVGVNNNVAPDSINGYYDDRTADPRVGFARVEFVPSSYLGDAELYPDLFFPPPPAKPVGTWLVRSSVPAPVPEPGTLALLGLVILGAWRRRRA